MVLMAQQFINTTYAGVSAIPRLDLTGRVGWSTMYALTRALQYELNIASLSDSFGPTTLATLTSKYPTITQTTTLPLNIGRIIQAGLYCKGYDGGETHSTDSFTGVYSDRVATAVLKLKTDAGVNSVYPGGALVPKVFKAMLTMDAYV